ncbi:MAG TPA: CsgG/HfaB family protein [Verrucomicrobiae bacterium]|nr:CsgG/HfaB family protein [Verrucomicrobiae bacterium]
MTRRLVGLLLVFVILVIACAEITAFSGSSIAAAAPDGAPAPTGSQPPPFGPKKRIAVARFDASGVITNQYPGWNIGDGLAAQLTTALLDSGYFIVVERNELAGVLREQEMAVQKITSKETAAQVGRLLGTQLLVRGSVTEFSQGESGGGLRVGGGTGGGGFGLGGFGFGGGGVGGALGLQSVHGVVAMDIRLIDTSTGKVLQSQRAESSLDQRGVSADINVHQVAFGGDEFNKTVLGHATRDAIEKAVAIIIRAMDSVPWTGRVVEVMGDQVYINAGSSSGVKPGDAFAVTTVVKELTDPDSGEVLTTIEERRGDIELVDVQEKFSIGRMRAPFETKRGDLVKYSQ